MYFNTNADMPCQQFNYIKVWNNNLHLEIALTRGEDHSRAAIADFLARHYRAPANYQLYFKDQQGQSRQMKHGNAPVPCYELGILTLHARTQQL